MDLPPRGKFHKMLIIYNNPRLGHPSIPDEGCLKIPLKSVSLYKAGAAITRGPRKITGAFLYRIRLKSCPAERYKSTALLAADVPDAAGVYSVRKITFCLAPR
jgi:hypothetical protein